jgi:putative ABC transport system permease protein
MFLRLVSDSFARRPRHKLLTGAALALGMAVATAALSVALDVGDRLAREFRSLGANLLVTPQADSLPLEIGGVDYRPVDAGAYLPEYDLGKLKTIFWRNNIVGFAPILETTAYITTNPNSLKVSEEGIKTPLIGTWASRPVFSPDGSMFTTGIEKTNPWFHVDGRWFSDDAGGLKRVNVLRDQLPPGAIAGHYYVPSLDECVVGANLAKRLNLRAGTQIYFNVPDWTMPQLVQPCSVTGILSAGGAEDDSLLMSLSRVQQFVDKRGEYRKLYVSALTKPEDDFGRRDPNTLTPAEYDYWYCSPYVSSIALQIKQVLPGADVRVIRRVADGEGQILTRVRTLLWLVTFAALLAAALAVGASSAASVIQRRTEIGLMKALGAGSGTVGSLLAAEQLLLAFVGGGLGYALGIFLARYVGQKIFGAAPAFSFLVLAVIIGLATVVTLLGSAIPLRRASRYEPAPILRGE